MRKLTREEAESKASLVQQFGGIRKAARATGVSFGQLQRAASRVSETKRQEWPLPEKGKVNRYIFTCAQNNTKLFAPAWASLNALAKHYNANIFVSTFTYDTSVRIPKRGKDGKTEDGLWYAPELVPHLLDDSVLVAPDLVFCGELNILPTAERPLSGFESYTGSKSGIFPHPRIAMESIAGIKAAKFNYTTGTVTRRNYIAKKAGQKADFHHSYGGLLVEVDSAGDWWARQLNSDSSGKIHDLDVVADGKRVSKTAVEAINWGDIHWGTVDPNVVQALWGPFGMLDKLKPRWQFMHDALDFRARNHHDRHDPHKMFQKFCTMSESVQKEIEDLQHFLQQAHRRTCRTVVVDSNHDGALGRWLREADYKTDPVNAVFFLRAQAEVYGAISRGDRFHLLGWALQHPKGTTFLGPNESIILCKKAGGGIECGMHGHLGVNGSRGSLRSFARMGSKSNTGHTHSARIIDGAYCAGVTGSLDQGYNKGPSSWSRSHIVTYKNGKRAIVTMRGDKWRA